MSQSSSSESSRRSTSSSVDHDRPTRRAVRDRAAAPAFDGRYPIDPFGFDPQLVDLVAPLFTPRSASRSTAASTCPTTGPAVLVANRGFGIAEPAVLGIAVRRAVGAPAAHRRRARGAGRSVGSLAGSARSARARPTSRACLRAGHLVAVPLAPTWLRTGAGHPAAPVAAGDDARADRSRRGHARRPVRHAVRPWQVRFGPLVTLARSVRPRRPARRGALRRSGARRGRGLARAAS